MMRGEKRESKSIWAWWILTCIVFFPRQMNGGWVTSTKISQSALLTHLLSLSLNQLMMNLYARLPLFAMVDVSQYSAIITRKMGWWVGHLDYKACVFFVITTYKNVCMLQYLNAIIEIVLEAWAFWDSRKGQIIWITWYMIRKGPEESISSLRI